MLSFDPQQPRKGCPVSVLLFLLLRNVSKGTAVKGTLSFSLSGQRPKDYPLLVLCVTYSSVKCLPLKAGHHHRPSQPAMRIRNTRGAATKGPQPTRITRGDSPSYK